MHPSSLQPIKPTRHRDLLARNPSRIVSRQKDRHLCNIIGMPDTAQWRILDDRPFEVAARYSGRTRALGFHPTRQDGIDADVPATELL